MADWTHTSTATNAYILAPQAPPAQGVPWMMTLRELIQAFVDHRHEIITRRTQYLLRKAEERAHILEGLKIALDHLDAVIALIRAAKDVETALTGRMQTFKLSEIQASAILEMRLARLTALERSKVEQECLELIQLIESLRSILASPQTMLAIIQDEERRLKEKYGDARRTQIISEEGEIGYEDTIEQKDMVITIHLSEGRFEFGTGRGSSSTEFKGFGIPDGETTRSMWDERSARS